MMLSYSLEIEGLVSLKHNLMAEIERYRRNEELQMLRAIRAEAKIEQLQAALKLIADDKRNCMDHCRRQATRALEKIDASKSERVEKC